jgi:pyruvate ferredoxin oxidoreductase delta subunit
VVVHLKDQLEKAPEPLQQYEGLSWVVVHGRGVIHTGHANSLVRALATAGNFSGKESYYYMRYDDSPERDHIPHLFYAVFGNPTIDVVLHEEIEPVGQVFDAIVVMDSSMLLHQTSQRALPFDGAKKDAVLVVNTSLSPEEIVRLVKGYALAEDWEGKLVTIRAKSYDPDIAYPLLGALAKAFGIVSIGDLTAALDFLGQHKKVDSVRRAYDESRPVSVTIRAEDTDLAKQRVKERVRVPAVKRGLWWDRSVYEQYKAKAAEAHSYSERIESMPRWEALAPGLIEFGPLPGEKNIGFKTSFSRNLRPVIDKDRCTGCKLCSIYCPDGAIDFGTIKVDYDYCQGCAICAQVCPPKAVEMVSELKIKEGMNEEMVTTVAEALREYGY